MHGTHFPFFTYIGKDLSSTKPCYPQLICLPTSINTVKIITHRYALDLVPVCACSQSYCMADSPGISITTSSSPSKLHRISLWSSFHRLCLWCIQSRLKLLQETGEQGFMSPQSIEKMHPSSATSLTCSLAALDYKYISFCPRTLGKHLLGNCLYGTRDLFSLNMLQETLSLHKWGF